jgi:hypothetical protein
MRYSDSYSYCPWSYFMGEAGGGGGIESELNQKSAEYHTGEDDRGGHLNWNNAEYHTTFDHDTAFDYRITNQKSANDETNPNDCSLNHSHNPITRAPKEPITGNSFPPGSPPKKLTQLPRCSLHGLLRSKFLKVLAGNFHSFFPCALSAFEALEAALEPFGGHAKHILHQFPLLDWNRIDQWLEASASPALKLYKELVSIRDVSVMITLVKPGGVHTLDSPVLDADFVPLRGSGGGLWARVKLIDLDDKLNDSKVIEHAGQTREILDFLRQNEDFECYSAV